MWQKQTLHHVTWQVFLCLCSFMDAQTNTRFSFKCHGHTSYTVIMHVIFSLIQIKNFDIMIKHTQCVPQNILHASLWLWCTTLSDYKLELLKKLCFVLFGRWVQMLWTCKENVDNWFWFRFYCFTYIHLYCDPRYMSYVWKYMLFIFLNLFYVNFYSHERYTPSTVRQSLLHSKQYARIRSKIWAIFYSSKSHSHLCISLTNWCKGDPCGFHKNNYWALFSAWFLLNIFFFILNYFIEIRIA